MIYCFSHNTLKKKSEKKIKEQQQQHFYTFVFIVSPVNDEMKSNVFILFFSKIYMKLCDSIRI